MTPTELEQASRRIVAAALEGKSVEDSRVELKAQWISAESAARRLAGHANAARGENILWIFGVDERTRKLTSVNPIEKADWYQAVERHFDGFAPRLLVDVHFEIEGSALVSLYFDTHHEPPYVIKGTAGGYPQYTVPWRVGTAVRAANRAQMLSVIVPMQTLSGIKEETEYNCTVATNFGGLFRTDHFIRAIGSGLLATLSEGVRKQIQDTYALVELSNQKTIGYHQFSGNWHARGSLGEEVGRAFQKAREAVLALRVVLDEHKVADA